MMANSEKITDQEVEDAFNVAIQDRLTGPPKPKCPPKPPPVDQPLPGVVEEEDQGPRKLSRCERQMLESILSDRLSSKGITGPIADKMKAEKLTGLVDRVEKGCMTLYEAKSEARNWLGKPLPSCLTASERMQAKYDEGASGEAAGKDVVFGMDNKDAFYEELAVEINSSIRQEFSGGVDNKNKLRVTLNEALNRYNCLVEEIPALEQERDLLVPTLERKRNELVKLRADLLTWNREKPKMEAELYNIACLREDKETEMKFLRKEIESVKENILNHESALNKLRCMPPEMQECYSTLEKLVRDQEEAQSKLIQVKDGYSKMYTTTKLLADTILGLKYLPDIVRYFSEYPDNELVSSFMTERGINTKRLIMVEAKVQHSIVLATRLRQILERFEQNERRVQKGLLY